MVPALECAKQSLSSGLADLKHSTTLVGILIYCLGFMF